jgi:hypothetical protein
MRRPQLRRPQEVSAPARMRNVPRILLFLSHRHRRGGLPAERSRSELRPVLRGVPTE